MKIHSYEGYSQPQRAGFMEDLLAAGSGLLAPTPSAVDYTVNTGWVATRAAGILAILLSAWDMPYSAMARWMELNGISDWIPTVSNASLSADEQRLIGADGNMYFLNDYPLPVDWADRWATWKQFGLDVVIPVPTASTTSPTATPVIQTAAPASVATQTDATKSMYRAILGAIAFSLFG